MDPATTAAVAYQTYKTGKEVCGTIGELMSKLEDFKDRSVVSLTEYTKRTLITSRVYVEDQIATEEITPKLLKMLNQMYSGFVMTAVGLNNLIVNGRNVRQMTAPIATEAFHSFADFVKENFGDPAMEANQQTVPSEGKTDGDKPAAMNSADIKKLEAQGNALFTGNLLEAKIPGPDGKEIPLYFYVQLLPIVVPQPTMEEFMRANVSPSLKLRWAMWKAGEIRFFKDFIFEADRVAKRRKALKADKDGFLREMEDHRAKMLKEKVANMKNKEADARRRNLCNSIVLVTKRTMDTVCKDIGINLKSFTQRQELMQDIFAVMLCVIDTNYGTVDLYMNGIEGRGEYNVKMIEAATKNKDAFDVKELLALISAGSMPRF